MNIRCIVTFIFASTLMLCPLDAWAQSGAANPSAMVFPPTSLPDYGGALGFEIDTQRYQISGMYVFRVIGVSRNSPLINMLHAGDYIYNINGYYLRNSDDVYNVIHSGAPGAQLSLSYLDPADGLSPKGVKAVLIPAPGAAVTTGPSQRETGDGLAPANRVVRRTPGPGCVPYSEYAVNCQTSDEFRTSHGLPTQAQERTNMENETRKSASHPHGKNSVNCVHIEYPSSGRECGYLENKTLGCGISRHTSAVNSCPYDVDVVFQSGAVITIGANSIYNYYTGDIVLSRTRAH